MKGTQAMTYTVTARWHDDADDVDGTLFDTASFETEAAAIADARQFVQDVVTGNYDDVVHNTFDGSVTDIARDPTRLATVVFAHGTMTVWTWAA